MPFFEIETPCIAGLGLILLFGVVLQRGVAQNTWLLPLAFALAAIIRAWWYGTAWDAFCLFPVWSLLLLFLASELIERLCRRQGLQGTGVANYWITTFLLIVMKTTFV